MTNDCSPDICQKDKSVWQNWWYRKSDCIWSTSFAMSLETIPSKDTPKTLCTRGTCVLRPSVLESCYALFINMLVPFQLSMSCFHILRSPLNSLLSLMWYWGLISPFVSAIIRKGRPGRTTLHAESRVPMSDCDSFRAQDFLHSHPIEGFYNAL